MPVPLTALFAATIHQVRAAASDAAAMDRALSLLSRAAGGIPVTLEIMDDEFMVNDMPVSTDAPGVAAVMACMLGHDTARLSLPGHLELHHWRSVAELFASAAGLFESPAHLIEALHAAVPGAELVSAGLHGPVVDSLAGDTELSQMPPATGKAPGDVELSSATGERAKLSVQLDPLLAECRNAVDGHDYERFAAALIDLHVLEHSCNDAERSIVARERRRMISSDQLETLVRLLPKSPMSDVISRAIISCGKEGIDAIIESLNGAEGRPERRVYIDALAAAPNAEEAILKALSSHRPDLVAAAAEVAGRQRMAKAVPQLSHLLRHAMESVRTAAWRSLESIGTHEAIQALNNRIR